MADVAMGNLRFDLTADNTQFMAAVKQAKEAQTQAASEMGSKFAEASNQAQRSLTQMAEAAGAKALDLIKKLQDIGKQMQAAFQSGAEGSEKFATDNFNKIFAKAESGFQALIAMAPGWWGKIFAGLYELGKGSGAIDAGIEFLKKKVAGGLDNLIGKAQTDKWTTGIRDGLVATVAATNMLMGGAFDQASMDESQKRVETWADGIKKKMEEMVEGVRTALQKLAGTWDGVSEAVKKAIEGLKERGKADEFQTGLLGLNAGDRTRRMEEKRLEEEMGKTYDELNEKEKKLYTTELELRVARAQGREDRQKELEGVRQYDQAVTALTSALKRQGDMALANAGRANGAKSAFDRAIDAGNAMAEGYGRGRVSGLQDDPAVIAARNEAARKAQDAANLGYRAEQARMLQEANDRGFLDQSSLGATPGAVEKLRVEMDLMNKARREGVTLDANQLSLNAMIADSMGKIAQATAEARERFEAFREVGRTVASSLEDAFGRFISGTQVHWKEFIAGLQADLAKLAFKKGIESLLLGTATGGGGLFAGLAGLISGARADGGPVGSGKAYIVGERGPEMFVPQSAGSIVSNQAMSGGAGPTNINMRIDLAGANGDETIARISATAARQAALAAVQQSNDGFAMRQRRLTMLGT